MNQSETRKIAYSAEKETEKKTTSVKKEIEKKKVNENQRKIKAVCCNTIVDDESILYYLDGATFCGDLCPFCGQASKGTATRFVYDDAEQEMIIGYMCSCGAITKELL